MTEPAFSSRDPAEVFPYGFDFTAVIEEDETIESAVFTTAFIEGGDDTNPLATSGSADLADVPIVWQTIIGGTVGCTYRIKATVTTDAGHTYVGSASIRVVSGVDE